MPITIEDVLALENLENRLRTLLPEQYQDTYEEVMPVSMGSAGLKYDDDGRVAWDRMWQTFCDLAMAGGPPHRGALLEPASPAPQDQSGRVSVEICRGIELVTGLKAQPSSEPGWIQVTCKSVGMAAWLVRAIVMENVLARHQGELLYLPYGPDFRMEREIKNVITVMAKTCHYWAGHTSPERQQSMEQLLTAPDSQLLEPGASADRAFVTAMSERIHAETTFPCFAHRYAGWVGVECPSVRAAIWIMRGLVTQSVLARREGEVLFIPANPSADPNAERCVCTFLEIHHLASVKKIL
jgi:sirohydrochlorin cobaltochelatase